MLHRPTRIAQTLLALLATALLLGGCAPGMLDRGAAEFAERSDEARQLERQDRWQAAAETWQQAAEAGRGADRDLALVAAAEAWLRAGEADRARSALAGVAAEPGRELAARRALLESRLLLDEGRPEDAFNRLRGLPASAGDPEAAAILAMRAEAAFASRQPVTGVAALARREALLDTPAQRAANQRRIWNRMQEAVAAGLRLETPPGADSTLDGWLALGRAAAASEGNLFRLRAGVVAWREQHPTHPAAVGIVDNLLAEFRAMTEYPRSVALLLPLSGTQAAAAAAVRDGFIAALLTHDQQAGRPEVRVYDTTALGPIGAIELAARNGAEFMVGPLLKDELGVLSGAILPTVPSLALNWADPHLPLPPHMFQFALAPEEEAEAAARRAAADGRRRALVLVHDTDQGRRMAESFIAAFRAEGGEVLGWTAFNPREADHSAEITSLLLLQESRARHQRLQRDLGRTLEYEPRRRQDADFIFLAARPAEALLIRPQLRFHFAGDLPVYATSSVYDPGRGANTDLDGVLFADMPWRVGVRDMEFMAGFQAFGRTALERSGRLYAFGVDAYRLVPLLYNRSDTLLSGMDGVTGTLRVGADGRIQREPAWGRFHRGEVRPAPPETPLLEARRPAAP